MASAAAVAPAAVLKIANTESPAGVDDSAAMGDADRLEGSPCGLERFDRSAGVDRHQSRVRDGIRGEDGGESKTELSGASPPNFDRVIVPSRAAVGELSPRLRGTLGLGMCTVKSHMTSILSKLGVTSRTQAAAVAATRGLIELHPVSGWSSASATNRYEREPGTPITLPCPVFGEECETLRDKTNPPWHNGSPIRPTVKQRDRSCPPAETCSVTPPASRPCLPRPGCCLSWPEPRRRATTAALSTRRRLPM